MTESSERFEFEKRLGAGGFGEVWLGYDTVLEAKVAIKVPYDEKKANALVHEAKLMNRIVALQEPRVVRLSGLYEVNGKWALVMEFIEGRGLRARIGEIEDHPSPPMNAVTAIDIVSQICQGLGTLHGAFENEGGIFHRDIKPENILIQEPDDIVKIADFGISKILEASGAGTTTVGTPPYMAPELCAEEGADYRADIYSLGITFYEMLTGQLPFNPYSAPKKPKPLMPYLREIVRGYPTHPSEVADVDEELGNIVLKALHREVNQRYQTVREFYEALENYQRTRLVDQAIAAALKETHAAARERALARLANDFSNDPKVYLKIAEFYAGQFSHQKVRDILEKGRLQCAKSPELLMHLALAYNKVKQTRWAIMALEDALQEDIPRKMRVQMQALLNNWRNAVGEE